MLTADTVIITLAGNFMVSELVGRSNIIVLSWDIEQGESVLSVIRKVWPAVAVPMLTVSWDSIVEGITNSNTAVCSYNHAWVMREGIYRKACELAVGDLLQPFMHHPTWGIHRITCVEPAETGTAYGVETNSSFLGYQQNFALSNWVYTQNGS